ncbi:Uncharacterised protein [uncultured archaeon]|nr:Uncharacterised protein [uncultured archaeon]
MITGIVINEVNAKVVRRQPIESFETKIQVQGASFTENAIAVGFRWDVLYAPNISYLSMEGVVSLAEAPERIQQVMAQWQKEGSIPPEMVQELTNGINHYCTLNSALVVRPLDLLPPIHVPIVGTQPAKQ